ncbi:MAG TPA: hypothetical protein PKD09_15900 [Aggregatilinea sp.]|jgi:hypothetical protein|uniref:hypothetical protein n=1 Tax=Aggregatilinea sp. TaxID=2806333 RepID=UPI002BF7B36D|nr:hypothetical protein [Aggregatilinea sp.]HML23137.1 hypothetical protein [Aggregatilinea sp.]
MAALLLPIAYHLEIYEPDSQRAIAASFASSMPFQRIGVGDVINPMSCNDDSFPPVYLRVVNVEHVILQNGDHIDHKVLIFTEGLRESHQEPALHVEALGALE